MNEGPIQESSYFFPAEDISRYIKELKDTPYYEDILFNLDTDIRILILTHDDIFDHEMNAIEKEYKITSTWFLDPLENVEKVPEGLDIQLHFNKESPFTLKDQINMFKNKYGKMPKFNRNHRLLWRSNNFDFPFLAMNGIIVDSTLIGTRPFIPIISGKKIPIIELPFSISDIPQRPMALYTIPKIIETPFRNGQNLITVLSHPFDICNRFQMNSCFKEVIDVAEKYDYLIMNIEKFIKSFKHGEL